MSRSSSSFSSCPLLVPPSSSRASMKRKVSSGEGYGRRWSRRDEIEVASILLSMPDLISRDECRCRFFLPWGAKRRRSAPSSVSTQQSGSLPAGRRSPTTPLFFPPSDSDETRGRSSRKIVKGSGALLDHLILEKKVLTKAIDEKRRDRDRLKLFRTQLKARKEKIIEEQTAEIVCDRAGLSVEPGDPPLESSIAVRSVSHVDPPSARGLMFCKIRENEHADERCPSPDSKSLAEASAVGEGCVQRIMLGFSPTDDRKVRASQARKERIEIQRKKKPPPPPPLNRTLSKTAPPLTVVPAVHRVIYP